ncbi:MAG TPA: Wzz/FepE/Etk N-terminal domain-containing protein [Chloroflexia bacterium]|nr:Wzz/FepE/Etk N-terminal domain-containing protein [Chloroflexia bacterium]
MQLKDYLKVIQKRWWLAIIVALAAGAVAFLYSVTQPKVYETTITVVGTPARPDEGLNNAIKSEIRRWPSTLKSSDAAAAIDKAGAFDLGQDAISGAMKINPQPDTFTLQITVDYKDPKWAARIANAAADYIRDQNLKAVANTPDDSKIFFDKVAPAPVPDRPSLPRTNLNSAAGLALGLILGIILIFVVEYFDNSFRTVEDVEHYTGLNVLGAVPPWRYSGQTLPKTTLSTEPARNGHSKNSNGVISPQEVLKKEHTNQ